MAKRKSSSPSIAMEDTKWRARNALDTLTRAEEIKKDRGLMREVKREASEQKKALERVCAPKSKTKK